MAAVTAVGRMTSLSPHVLQIQLIL